MLNELKVEPGEIVLVCRKDFIEGNSTEPMPVDVYTVIGHVGMGEILAKAKSGKVFRFSKMGIAMGSDMGTIRKFREGENIEGIRQDILNRWWRVRSSQVFSERPEWVFPGAFKEQQFSENETEATWKEFSFSSRDGVNRLVAAFKLYRASFSPETALRVGRKSIRTNMPSNGCHVWFALAEMAWQDYTEIEE